MTPDDEPRRSVIMDWRPKAACLDLDLSEDERRTLRRRPQRWKAHGCGTPKSLFDPLTHER